MKPVLLSTSKSWAARVVVSGAPAGGPAKMSGRGSDRKWLVEMGSMGIATVDEG